MSCKRKTENCPSGRPPAGMGCKKEWNYNTGKTRYRAGVSTFLVLTVVKKKSQKGVRGRLISERIWKKEGNVMEIESPKRKEKVTPKGSNGAQTSHWRAISYVKRRPCREIARLRRERQKTREKDTPDVKDLRLRDRSNRGRRNGKSGRPGGKAEQNSRKGAIAF